MSKLSFRARALDATKSMPIYRKHEVSDLPDYSVLNRAVPQMPTGMEKEEESEHHLQRAISAQQVYGDKKVMVIPVPEAELGVEYYNNIYKKQFRVPKQYIHNQAQALNSIMEQEKPDYDMDSEDERWVKDTNKRTGLDISEIQFEEMIDRLEKSCGNQVVTLQEAKLLLKEDDDLIKAVYDYWLQKRAKPAGGAVTFHVRQERRDGSSSGDSYVAFRRRTEKMQTRKNRKNDEASYEKMLKLRRDLSRAVTILEMIKRREKGKWELLHLTLEIAEKRYQMKDWDGKSLKMAKREVAVGSGNLKAINRTKHLSGNKSALGLAGTSASKQRVKSDLERKEKRRSKKNKHDRLRLPSASVASSISSSTNQPVAAGSGSLTSNVLRPSPHKPSQHPPAHGSTPKSPGSTFTYEHVFDTMRQYEFHSSDEDTARPKSPTSGSVAPSSVADERKKNPDGLYAFRRKPGCKYNAPRDELSGDHWPWMTEDRHRYSLTTLTMPEKCMGFCRRRVGRGGRVMLDRAYTPWNKQLSEIDLHPEANHLPHKPNLQELLEEIKHGRWRRYRPYDPLSHKAHKLKLQQEQQDNRKLSDLKPFGHSSTSPMMTPVKQHSSSKKVTKSQPVDSSDSETIDIMTTDENIRTDLLHKRLLQKSPHKSSPQKHRTTPHKRVLVPSWQLDKPSALFAVSALMTSDSPNKQRVKAGKQLKLNVVSASSPSTSNGMPARQTPVAMTLIGGLPVTSPGKYVTNLTSALDKSSPKVKKPKTISKFTIDHTKLFGVKGNEKMHATLMPVSSLHAKSTTSTSVTLTVTGPTSKSLTTFCGSSTSGGVVSLTMAQPHSSIGLNKNSNQSGMTLDGLTNATALQKSTTMPVVMATLRIGNSVTSSSAMVNSNSDSHPLLASSYTINSQGTNSGDNSNGATGTVFITPTTRFVTPTSRIHQSKHAGNEIQNSSVPLTLSTVNSSLIHPQYKTQLLGQQSLNLALTPSTPQKHATLSQLSIPNSSGHASAILIATPASGTLASSLPQHGAPGLESGTAGGINLNQTKTVSINVARVQTSASGMGQIFTLQQHPDGNVGTLTASQASQHTGSAWVTSGSGPNILKLGPAGVATGIQIHPVNQGFKMGTTNKSLTVISKRPRGQQPTVGVTRTINIANSRQATSLINNANNKSAVASPHIALVSDNRTNSTPKSLISIPHPQKNNATVMLSAKNVPIVEQSCVINKDGGQTPAPLNTQTDNIVNDSPGLNSKSSKNNQPMEVT
uniref:enhancer of polycomb homolog 1-like isoform X1 n=1 Tax=Styela clava TaxID=7725 RepID=UPI001939582D|nr:enhancer of polycomb homolog 1-like isoform X1 [Styela clava]